MFNFHKPRVYRSTDGCCICRAKSSSSRFTASRKYEKESMLCFNLEEPRNGEICNACVLLVKRYKRLPAGSKRHWGHVVDARAGPGTKSLAKQKKRDNDGETKATGGSSSCFIPEKFAKIFKKNRKGKHRTTQEQAEEHAAANNGAAAANRPKSSSPTSEQPSDSNESYDEERARTPPHVGVAATAAPYQTRKRTAAAALAANGGSGSGSNAVQRIKVTGSKRRRILPPIKHRRAIDNVPFFEEHDLLRLDVCCGTVFQSLTLTGYYIIDADLYKPCEKHRQMRQQAAQQMQKPPTVLVSNNNNNNRALTTNNTPALKKHHLFFKRQSESFPQGDINRISPIPLNKTDTGAAAATTSMMPVTATGTTTTTTTAATANTTSTYMAHHSMRTSPTKLPAAATAQAAAAAGLSLILKPAASKLLDIGGNATATIILQPNANITTTAVGAASPSSLSSSSNCSTSSSVATKFNDNSSDSGFDEHVLERKSVSPPTQDELQTDKKNRSASGVGMQRLILASGLPITGQAQNLVLAGNEFTARFVQQLPAAGAAAAHKSSVKVNVLGSQGGASSNGAPAAGCNKIRAIFNAANTIQHENGVTTILPASSLAASNQTAAMNAIAPSTVTITPAPAGGGVAKKIALSNTNNAGGGSNNGGVAVQQSQALPLPISNAGNSVVANPKFILLKPTTAKFNNNNSNAADAKIV